ncbi:MAG TPA: hypothetical protein VNF28_04835 [Candidatus Binataceae bacterium]|nr:hypothetical protein [Candidatus Binataceae bacterium]
MAEEERWTFTPITDFSSAESARAFLESLLRDWETEWDVIEQLRFHLEFESCILETQAEDGKLAVVTFSVKALSLGAACNLKRPPPSPPSGKLHSTPLAGRLRARWHDIDERKERLLVGANWVLTALEDEFGKSKKRRREITANALKVDLEILKTLGRLCAQNDPDQGRKSEGEIKRLTNNESTWVHQTVRMLVRRAVEIDSGIVDLPFFTMKDLPPL